MRRRSPRCSGRRERSGGLFHLRSARIRVSFQEFVPGQKIRHHFRAGKGDKKSPVVLLSF